MSYQGILEGLGAEILMMEETGSYQGDLVFILGDDSWLTGGIGVLVQGYGSCSGCDAWEAASSFKDRLDIAADMINNIRWFPSGSELLEWLLADHEDQWWGHDTEIGQFFLKVARKIMASVPKDQLDDTYRVRRALMEEGGEIVDGSLGDQALPSGGE